MGGALTPGTAALLGGLLLALPAAAAELERVFLTDGYRYVPAREVDEATADVGQALCGTRCNALAGNYDSYLMTMNWRLTKVEGVTERVIDLANPFLDGRCICTGEEFTAEYYYYRPGVPDTPEPAARAPSGAAAAGGQTGGAPR